MCGIVGYWGGNHVNADTVEQMALQIANRGPDDSGVWIDKASGIAFGHRRLSILDLSSAGHQPMHSESGRFVVIYNGEIYNHLTLRSELALDGDKVEWRGHSDTETLLALVEHWGIEKTLEQAIGMFAFALWDKDKKTLTLARDRVGEKPLYYGRMGDVLLFGSELKALRKYPEFRSNIDRDALTLFMRHSYIPAPYTIYKDIKKLPPGSYIEIDNSNCVLEPNQYWSARKVAEYGQHNQFEGSAADAESQLTNLLSQSISDQMLSDVPVGAFLSGGIDSSTIIALMQQQCNQAVRSFSIGFHEKEYNEAHHAKAIATHLNTDHLELYVTPEEAMGVIPRLPEIYDEPFADTSQIPTFLVSQLARKHVTVSLSGDAGDELFGGYNRYIYAIELWKRYSLNLPKPFRAALAGIITHVPSSAINIIFQKLWWFLPKKYRFKNFEDKIKKLADILSTTDPEKIYLTLLSHWKNPSELVLNSNEPTTVLTDKKLWANLPDFENRMMYLDTVSYLPDDILVKVDRAAMAVSLETRVPFLDHRIIEFAWRLPLSMKIKSDESKWILRKLLSRHVPESLFDRPKMGFGVPIDHWIRGPLREWAENLLNEKKLSEQGYLNYIPVRNKWKEHLSGKQNWQYLLWDILMFQSWLEHQNM